MNATKAFWTGVGTLMFWLCLNAMAASAGIFAWVVAGPVGLAIYTSLWVLPTVTYWAYLQFRSDYER